MVAAFDGNEGDAGSPALDHGVVGIFGVEIKHQSVGGAVVELGRRARLPVVHIIVGYGVEKPGRSRR